MGSDVVVHDSFFSCIHSCAAVYADMPWTPRGTLKERRTADVEFVESGCYPTLALFGLWLKIFRLAASHFPTACSDRAHATCGPCKKTLSASQSSTQGSAGGSSCCRARRGWAPSRPSRTSWHWQVAHKVAKHKKHEGMSDSQHATRMCRYEV